LHNAADGVHVSDNTGPVVVQGNRALHNRDDGIDVGAQGAASATPVWSPDGQRIAFSADPASGGLPGGPGLYVSHPDGSNLLRLAAGEHPDWSPDGQRIAFASRSSDLGVYTIRADGSGLSKVAPSTSRPSRPDWSPDGQTIAYDDAGTIWSVAAAGGTPQALTSGTPANDPEWSPDGSRILFESHPFILGDGGIYLTGAGGGPRTFLASGQGATWAPDGDHIVFVQQGDLFVIEPDGSGLRQLTSGAARPSVSPDGISVAFMRSGGADSGLYTIGIDGTGLVMVTPSEEPGLTGGQGPPSWSPDSSRITFDVDGRL
jgi:Tol biopolymer transport system component